VTISTKYTHCDNINKIYTVWQYQQKIHIVTISAKYTHYDNINKKYIL